MSLPETMTFDGDALRLLDQRALPGEVRYELCRTADETARAIQTLVVRGAPAIGVAAAFGIALAAKRANEGGMPLGQPSTPRTRSSPGAVPPRSTCSGRSSRCAPRGPMRSRVPRMPSWTP